ncbi:FMN-binding glutamate synthase family protein [Rapidithrix thailandica]|uniref:FMN-binding glutamate synthase family protein n=1 Tax=Rapidithrix thailandica TaxID=413964 RepID=A0AAW9S693_9BACT
MRYQFFKLSILLILVIGVTGYYYPPVWMTYWLLIPLTVIGIFNSRQNKHTILRNFPILGYFRYFFEFISPEIQQYFIERNTDGRPFSRNQRALAYRRAKNVNDTHPFGTQLELNALNYEGLRHSIYAVDPLMTPPRVNIGSSLCQHPYKASLFNISAMSYGALSKNAILALNKGAARGHFYHNTGEGGISDYHMEGGGDLVWQIGTGYFGCRTPEGQFDPEKFKEKALLPNVKMIEIKLSQGAKPGHGGVLPGVKNTPEIAKIRGLEPYTTVVSPPSHREFSDAKGLLNFVQKLRELSGGKPVGFKLCIGKTEEFIELCEQMKTVGIWPDFITIDGAEGGTGAAPLEFSDSVGLPIEPALIFVSKMLTKYQLKQEIRVIASGKVLTASSLIKLLAMGADLCNSARGFMFALGCIQALRCNTNQCPTGVATQSNMLTRGLIVTDKAERVFHFHQNTLDAVLELLAACGKRSLEEIGMEMFIRGDEFIELENRYFPDSFTYQD